MKSEGFGKYQYRGSESWTAVDGRTITPAINQESYNWNVGGPTHVAALIKAASPSDRKQASGALGGLTATQATARGCDGSRLSCMMSAGKTRTRWADAVVAGMIELIEAEQRGRGFEVSSTMVVVAVSNLYGSRLVDHQLPRSAFQGSCSNLKTYGHQSMRHRILCVVGDFRLDTGQKSYSTPYNNVVGIGELKLNSSPQSLAAVNTIPITIKNANREDISYCDQQYYRLMYKRCPSGSVACQDANAMERNAISSLYDLDLQLQPPTVQRQLSINANATGSSG
ncbi:hypothetical protein KCU88_g459, partial [Aureobasidium melanogenum]